MPPSLYIVLTLRSADLTHSLPRSLLTIIIHIINIILIIVIIMNITVIQEFDDSVLPKFEVSAAHVERSGGRQEQQAPRGRRCSCDVV